MNRTEESPPSAKDAEEKEENHLDRILESNACVRLFTWAGPKKSDSAAEAVNAEAREEQRLRWNFDFMTETPLPGRYQWVRTDTANGHPPKNGHAINHAAQDEVVERRNSRQRLSTPYCRKNRTASRTVEHSSTGSCDTPLNGPRRSETT